ncbi:MAG: peptidyl-prolyl cis-trans isomerase [Terriglobales bacterium]
MASAQVASHKPTAMKAAAVKPAVSPKPAGLTEAEVKALAKPVARVNDAVLTELDLIQEMYAIFPYARQHKSGFPKSIEPEIRRGALEMIIFDELLFQEAKRRKLTIAPARLAKAESDFRKQFSSPSEFRRYLQLDMGGSQARLREKIRRTLLIDQMYKTEISAKSKVSLAELKAYYAKNGKHYEHGDLVHIQSVSIMPPDATPSVLKEARKNAEAALKAAKAARTYREFGLVAEKMSEDDFRVKLGDHKERKSEDLPPEVVKVAKRMKPGEVSDLIQLGNAYTIIRLVKYTPAGKTPFSEVKAKLQEDLQKQKTEKVRSELAQKLRKNATIEKL